MSSATIIKLMVAFVAGTLAALAVAQLTIDPRLDCEVNCGRDTSPGPNF